MSHSSCARRPRPKSFVTGRGYCQLNVESLEDRRLLSANRLIDGTHQLMAEYYRDRHIKYPMPYHSLDSLLHQKEEPIEKCPGLRDGFCLPEKVLSRPVDAAMGSKLGLDDDWFSVDPGKKALIDRVFLP